MILDNELSFSTSAGQAAAFNVGTTVSTNVIDTGPLATGANLNFRDIGTGTGHEVYFVVTTTFVGATATIDIQIQTSASANLSSPTVLETITNGPQAVGTYAAGFFVRTDMPVTTNYKRYIGLGIVVATANVTAGAYLAYLLRDMQDVEYNTYAAGYSVS